MKILSILLSLIFLASGLSGQKASIFTNAKEIETARYSEFKGSPYLFEDWQLADIYDAKGKAFEQMLLNFNGYSNEVEVRKGNKYIELDQKWYTKIELTTKEGLKTYQTGLHKFFKNKFVEVLYDGEDLKLVKKFRSGVTEKEINDVGKTIKIKRFEKKTDYYFIKKGKLSETKLKKKSLLSFLGHKKELESFAKKNKLKITRIKDLKTILAHYEAQGF